MFVILTIVRWSDVAKVGLEPLTSLLLLSSVFYMGIACMYSHADSEEALLKRKLLLPS